MSIWWVMLVGGLLTFGIRFSFIFLLGRMDLPETARRALRFVPPAILSALVLPELLMPAGHVDFSLYNPRWLAGLLAGLVAWRTKSAPLTFLAGAVTLVLLLTLFPAAP
ncbi:MAG TPA: AzlD domain-containing protein [Anaerolineales bacterium]|nr:AzlD domain-containing protein [Anaerolineales bacterium]